MRTINYFESRPKDKEIILVGDRASVFIRQDIRELTEPDEDGNERTTYTAVEYSTIVNANGFEVTDEFVDKLIAHETAIAAQKVRAKRDALLDATDKEMTVDRIERESEQTVSAWKAYRQALRDIPEQAGFPFDVEWPVRP